MTTDPSQTDANGGKLEVCNECGQTPLLLACEQGKPNISDFLLTRGADISAKATKNMGSTCLHAAGYYNYADLADVLYGPRRLGVLRRATKMDPRPGQDGGRRLGAPAVLRGPLPI